MIEALAVLGSVAVAAGAVLTLALKALSEAKGRREEAVGRASAEARVTSLSTQLTDSHAREQQEKDRADAFEKAFDDLLADAAADGRVDGAYQRLLQARAAARAARGDRARAVHPNETADGGPDGLLSPWKQR